LRSGGAVAVCSSMESITPLADRIPSPQAIASSSPPVPSLFRSYSQSFIPHQEVVGQRLQRRRHSLKGDQGIEGTACQLPRAFLGLLQAHNRRIGRLVRRRVLTGGLAQLLAGLGDIEDVVDDLKGQAHVVA